MALTLLMRFSATILDSLGVEAIATAYALVDPGSTQTEIQDFFDNFVDNLDACIDGQITAAAWHVFPDLPVGIKSSPVALSRCSQTGVVNFIPTGEVHRWAFAMPALSNDPSVITIVGSKPTMNMTAGHPVPQLIASLSATGSSILEYCNDASQAPLVFSDSLISFREHNKQLSRQTFEV